MEIGLTQEVSIWMNRFINDLAADKQKVLDAVTLFPGNQNVVKGAIENGPENLSKEDADTCREILNFIEFYATGAISNLGVVSNASRKE